MIDDFSSMPSWSWLNKLQLISIDNGKAVLEPLAGQEKIAMFLFESKRKQIAKHITKLTGKPVSVKVKTSGSINSSDSNSKNGLSKNSTLKRGDRQAAMDMELVKQALSVFPDAHIINVNRYEKDAG